MDSHCHRCGASVGEDAPFCPICGAPQLRFDLPSEHPGGADGVQYSAFAPGQARIVHDPERRGVDWRRAFRVALGIAVPVGVLTALPGVSLGFLIWIVGGAATAVALYRRGVPASALDGRSGFRIGALTGFLAAYVSAALVGALELIERYRLHLGAAMDREYIQRMEQSTALVQTSPETEAQMRAYLHFLMTPDGRATVALAGAAMTSAVMILLAGVGGMIGVRFFGRERAI